MANALKTKRWPMLLKYAQANALDTSGPHSELPKRGQRLKGRPPPCALLVLIIGFSIF
jgi:hypothetical protein